MSFCGLLCGRRAFASTLRPCDGSHSSAEAHARLRHIRRWRRAASRQELMALVSKARVDDDEPANPVMRHEYVEHLLMSAAVVILASEELSTRCMSEMGELQRVAASWEWFSLQPKRVAVVARFIRGKTIHQMYLQCDQERDEAKSQRATLARTLARLRRALAFWENVKSLSSLQTALSRHLDLLDSILQPESLDELYERVIELHPVGPSPLPYDTCPSPVAAHSRPLSSIQATALANATAQQLFGHTRPPALGAATPADPSAPSVEGRGGSCLPSFSASSFSALQPGVDVMRLRNTLERMRVLSLQLPSTMALISSTSQQVVRLALVSDCVWQVDACSTHTRARTRMHMCTSSKQVTTPPLFFKMWPTAVLGVYLHTHTHTHR